MIVDPQIYDRTTTNRVLLRISGMKPKFDVANVEASELVFEHHTVTWTLQQFRSPSGDRYGLIRKNHHCSHNR